MMAERLADVSAQIDNVRQLAAVVTAMRGIAAARAQSGRSMLASAKAYTEVMSSAIGAVLNFFPSEAPASRSSGARPGLILFCAEQGFAGAFSERVLDAAGDVAGSCCLIVGSRGGAVAAERGLEAAWTGAMVSHVEAVPTLATQLGDALYRFIVSGVATKVDVLYPSLKPGRDVGVERHSLLPLDYGRFERPIDGELPLTNLEPAILLERLAVEYVHAQLCEAAIYAFEAENEARMAAMSAARSNIQDKLEDLQARERRLRQTEITSEIVELSAGAEALSGQSGPLRQPTS